MDWMNSCQMLECAHSILPIDLKSLQGVTHEYYRHSAIGLFAALDSANGTVLICRELRTSIKHS